MQFIKLNENNSKLSAFQVLDKCLPILPQVDRMAMLNANIIDLQWIADRTGGHWISGHVEGKMHHHF